jgi:hypothetical protein
VKCYFAEFLDLPGLDSLTQLCIICKNSFFANLYVFFYRLYKSYLARILTLHPHLPRYWVKLSSCYAATENLAHAHSCLSLARQHSTAQTAALVDNRVKEFLEKYPSFSGEAVLLSSVAEEQLKESNQEFQDLGSSVLAKACEETWQRESGPKKVVSDPQNFLADFESRWFR